MQLAKVLYRCGLEALRGLFQRIHPSWENEEDDLITFDKGKFKPDSHQASMFNSGNIYEWDISLICKVLLCTPVSKKKLKKEKDFRGCQGAITRIRDIKNKWLSHNKYDKVPNQDYQKSIEGLKTSVIQLGFDGGKFEETLNGSFQSIYSFYSLLSILSVNGYQSQGNYHTYLMQV